MDAADSGFDHLCSPHRPGHHELREHVKREFFRQNTFFGLLVCKRGAVVMTPPYFLQGLKTADYKSL